MLWGPQTGAHLLDALPSTALQHGNSPLTSFQRTLEALAQEPHALVHVQAIPLHMTARQVCGTHGAPVHAAWDMLISTHAAAVTPTKASLPWGRTHRAPQAT
jgi:hypothetical protein